MKQFLGYSQLYLLSVTIDSAGNLHDVAYCPMALSSARETVDSECQAKPSQAILSQNQLTDTLVSVSAASLPPTFSLTPASLLVRFTAQNHSLIITKEQTGPLFTHPLFYLRSTPLPKISCSSSSISLPTTQKSLNPFLGFSLLLQI